MKRYLYVLAFVLIVAALVLAGILIVRRNGAGTPIDVGGGATTPGGFPVSPPSDVRGGDQAGRETDNAVGAASENSEKKLVVAAEQKTLDFFVSGDGSIVLIQPDGQILEVKDGQISSLSSSPAANLAAAHFSHDGKKIIAVFGDRARPETSVFDIASKTWHPLLPNMQSPAWSPTDYRIAYLGERNGSGVLFTLDASKTAATPQEILKIAFQDARLRWVAQNQIILSDRGSALARGSAWGFDTKNKTLAPLIVDVYGLDSIWESQYGLAFIAGQGQRGGRLILLDAAAGTLLHEMSFSTLPSKCVFASKTVRIPIEAAASTKTTDSRATSTVATNTTLYCAIPRNVEDFEGATLPDSYFKKELFTEDDFYAIDLSDGATKAVSGKKSLSVDAENLKVFNDALFFINRLDEKLYAVSLK